jgi:hypothetical protein
MRYTGSASVDEMRHGLILSCDKDAIFTPLCDKDAIFSDLLTAC